MKSTAAAKLRKNAMIKYHEHGCIAFGHIVFDNNTGYQFKTIIKCSPDLLDSWKILNWNLYSVSSKKEAVLTILENDY